MLDQGNWVVPTPLVSPAPGLDGFGPHEVFVGRLYPLVECLWFWVNLNNILIDASGKCYCPAALHCLLKRFDLYDNNVFVIGTLVARQMKGVAIERIVVFPAP